MFYVYVCEKKSKLSNGEYFVSNRIDINLVENFYVIKKKIAIYFSLFL